MVDGNQDVIPSHLRLALGRCPFCGSAVREATFASLDMHRFRYTNDCVCLQYAVLVVEDDGYYWETISRAPQPEDARTRAIWDKWQNRDLDAIASDAALVPATEIPEPAAEFDAHLYEEAQIILSMFG